MDIKRAKEEIKNTVKAYLLKDEHGDYVVPAIRQRPILLIGAPGIGKTQIMEQITRECKIALVSYTITHHTRQSAVGLPTIEEEEFNGDKHKVTVYTMSEIIASVYRKMKEMHKKEGILFIDEINCVSETLAPTILQLLQKKMFGNQEVPKGWIIVAAGNPPEYNKSVREFDMVTLDRVRMIHVEPEYNVWKQYARSNHINAALLSYLELRPQNFYRVQTDVDGLQFVTARAWEDLSNLMDVYDELKIPVDEEVIGEYIQHKETAQDVAAYLDLYQKYQDDYGIQDILRGRVDSSVYERLLSAGFDERISVVNLLLSGLNQNFLDVSQKKQIMDLWYGFLKDYKSIIENSGSAQGVYNILRNRMKDAFEKELKQGYLNKATIEANRRALELINENMPEDEANVQNCFAKASENFNDKVIEMEGLEAEASVRLENAFDFMEAAFNNGQEMVVFVTELTMGNESSAFLADNKCKRYLEYNQNLLVGSRKSELLSKLAQDEIRGQEHSTEF